MIAYFVHWMQIVKKYPTDKYIYTATLIYNILLCFKILCEI